MINTVIFLDAYCNFFFAAYCDFSLRILWFFLTDTVIFIYDYCIFSWLILWLFTNPIVFIIYESVIFIIWFSLRVLYDHSDLLIDTVIPCWILWFFTNTVFFIITVIFDYYLSLFPWRFYIFQNSMIFRQILGFFKNCYISTNCFFFNKLGEFTTNCEVFLTNRVIF